jgi:hypothetical protein
LIWQTAGVLGIDPGPLSLRELAWMVEARRIDQWNHTASLLALWASIHRDPKKRRAPFAPAEFHPLSASQRGGTSRRGIRLTSERIGLLKVFLSDKKRRALEARQAKRTT